MKITLGRVFLVLFGGAVVGLLAYALIPRPVDVDLATVVSGRLRVTVDEDGRTRIKERYVVSAPLAGKMQRIDLEPGDRVEAGRTLLTTIAPTDPSLLDDRALAEAKARVEAAEAALARTTPLVERARVDMEYAETQLARVRQLDARDAVSDQEVDQAEREFRAAVEAYRAARFDQEIARYELEVARAALIRSLPRPARNEEDSGQQEAAPEPPADDPASDPPNAPRPSAPSGTPAPSATATEADGSPIASTPAASTGNGFAPLPEGVSRDLELRAPISGCVLRVLEENAKVVAPGEPLIELGNPRDLEIEIDVLSSDAVKIKPGATVLLEQWGGETPLEGVVRVVEPAGFTKISALGVEEQRVWVIADFTAPPESWSALGDAYRVEARIVVWEADDVVKVPTSALFREGDSWAVFSVEEGRARLRHVKIGRRNGLEAQVLEGLTPEAQVIVHPSDKVADGVRVRPRSAG